MVLLKQQKKSQLTALNVSPSSFTAVIFTFATLATVRFNFVTSVTSSSNEYVTIPGTKGRPMKVSPDPAKLSGLVVVKCSGLEAFIVVSSHGTAEINEIISQTTV